MGRLLKFREVADRLSCSLSNVYALGEAGVLPVHRIGLKKGLRVSEEDLETYLAKMRREGEGDPVTALRHIRLPAGLP